MDCPNLRRFVSLGSIKHILLHPFLWPRLPKFFVQLRAYRKMEARTTGRRVSLRFYACLEDAHPAQEGIGFYFYQDCWAARQVFRENPDWGVDVGSTVLLVGIMSQFKPWVSVDIRPIRSELAGLTCKPGSVLKLPFDDDEVPCLTTMCVLEHIGLGRYGDPLSPTGTHDAVREIARVIAPGGIVIYSVPVGVEERLEFNANRRFRYREAAGFFEGWELVDSTILTPFPVGYTSDAMFAAIRDPVACFCLRKPR